jgi:uncharacterized protein (TIGR00251 family)
VKISIHVKTGARENSVTKLDNASYRVAVSARPIEGKANEAVVKVLADYFCVPKSCIDIISGHSSSKKIVSIGQ